MTTIDTKSIDKTLVEALGDSKPTLVEFYNPEKECCRAMDHVLDELRKSIGDKANVLQIDGTASEDLMTEYKVDTYPTFILFKDGAEAWRDSGRKPVQELEHMIRSFI